MKEDIRSYMGMESHPGMAEGNGITESEELIKYVYRFMYNLANIIIPREVLVEHDSEVSYIGKAVDYWDKVNYSKGGNK